ncbi:hypothetical protein ACFQYP_60170 [Nonomuraea antimicrobica]
MSTAKSTSSTSTSAGMLRFCVSVRWSNSGAALRSSSGTSSVEAACVWLGSGLEAAPVVGAIAGISTDASGVGVVEMTGGTSALGIGAGFCGVVSGMGAGGEEVVFFGVGVLLALVGVAVTVLVTVVSGASSPASSVGVASLRWW